MRPQLIEGRRRVSYKKEIARSGKGVTSIGYKKGSTQSIVGVKRERS